MNKIMVKCCVVLPLLYLLNFVNNHYKNGSQIHPLDSQKLLTRIYFRKSTFWEHFKIITCCWVPFIYRQNESSTESYDSVDELTHLTRKKLLEVQEQLPKILTWWCCCCFCYATVIQFLSPLIYDLWNSNDFQECQECFFCFVLFAWRLCWVHVHITSWLTTIYLFYGKQRNKPCEFSYLKLFIQLNKQCECWMVSHTITLTKMRF